MSNNTRVVVLLACALSLALAQLGAAQQVDSSGEKRKDGALVRGGRLSEPREGFGRKAGQLDSIGSESDMMEEEIAALVKQEDHPAKTDAAAAAAPKSSGRQFVSLEAAVRDGVKKLEAGSGQDSYRSEPTLSGDKSKGRQFNYSPLHYSPMVAGKPAASAYYPPIVAPLRAQAANYNSLQPQQQQQHKYYYDGRPKEAKSSSSYSYSDSPNQAYTNSNWGYKDSSSYASDSSSAYSSKEVTGGQVGNSYYSLYSSQPQVDQNSLESHLPALGQVYELESPEVKVYTTKSFRTNKSP